MDHVCREVQLKAGETFLDVGWVDCRFTPARTIGLDGQEQLRSSWAVKR